MSVAETIQSGHWVEAASRSELAGKGKRVVKLDGKQILLWLSGGRVYACNNRCPHEGYPLAEGTMSDGCILTCNWHNWKFDLERGETLVGGDALRLYPVREEGDAILLDLTDPPAEELRAKAIDGLHEAFKDHDYDRMAREIARYEVAGGDPVDVLDHAFRWAADRFEFGMTHAQAGAADWLSLRRDRTSRDEALIPILEIVGHLSWDALMQAGPFPFPEGVADVFDPDTLEEAIEREDEAAAIAQTRAGLRDTGPEALHDPLGRAALRHYQNFGHTPIYFEKTYELCRQLTPRTAEALFLPFVRTLCKGAREDLIPEFRSYAPTMEIWDGEGRDVPTARAFRNKSVRQCHELIAGAGGAIDELIEVLFHTGADAMLHFDASYRAHVDRPIQENVDWLDFTHTLTHLSAARRICAEQAQLWPNALLQTGCFLGRNSGFTDWEQDVSHWFVDDPGALFDEVFAGLLDHGEPLYIYPVHALKLATALRQEVAADPQAEWVPVALAALNRFVHEPAKKKHMRRTVIQARKFVEAQG